MTPTERKQYVKLRGPLSRPMREYAERHNQRYGFLDFRPTPGAALRCARIMARWERAESAGLVRIRNVPDEESRTLDDLVGDTFDVEANASSVPGGARTIIAERKAFEERIERDGVWGIIGEYRLTRCPRCWKQGFQSVRNCTYDPDDYPSSRGPCPGWIHADSCYGFEYQDLEMTDYLWDIRQATLRALALDLKDRCPTCRNPRH